MKRIISIFLVISMIFVSSAYTFAADPASFGMDEGINEQVMDSITWGSWGSWNTITIPTGGLTTQFLAAIIWGLDVNVPVSVAAAVVGVAAANFDEITIMYRYRYGEDANYNYAETQLKFYGDGTLIYGPYTQRSKASKNGSIKLN